VCPSLVGRGSLVLVGEGYQVQLGLNFRDKRAPLVPSGITKVLRTETKGDGSPAPAHTPLVLVGNTNRRPVRLAYQPPASSTFLSEQTSHQQPASSTLLSEQTSTSHQPPANRTGC
jgi:hypothetical protein